ncbi:MAG: hypothetical protein RLO81_13465, partial [Fulvivirga sp.]|uniref:hypothetical protein n=1 Tax=Fulvivirga sp. TaxID=1931237 RepID=UPI0032EC38D5
TSSVKINVIGLLSLQEEIDRIQSKYEVVNFSKEEIFTENIKNLVDIQYWSEDEIKFIFIDTLGKASNYKINLND